MVHNRCKRRILGLTKGDVNKLIDKGLHPYFSENYSFIILDTAIHFLVESNPPESLSKFLRYNMMPLLRSFSKQAKKRTNRG